MAYNKVNKPIRTENYLSNCPALIFISMDVTHVDLKKRVWLLFLVIRSGNPLMFFLALQFR